MFGLRLDGPIIFNCIISFRLRVTIILMTFLKILVYLIKLPGVLIAIIDPNILAVDNNLAVDQELLRHDEPPRTI